MSPDVSQVASNSSQSHNINSSLNGSLGDEEERHPDQIEAELDSVECSALLGQEVLVEGGGSCHPGGVCAVGRVTHQAVKNGPGGAENIWRRAVGWLLECHVGLLAFFGC